MLSTMTCFPQYNNVAFIHVIIKLVIRILVLLQNPLALFTFCNSITTPVHNFTFFFYYLCLQFFVVSNCLSLPCFSFVCLGCFLMLFLFSLSMIYRTIKLLFLGQALQCMIMANYISALQVKTKLSALSVVILIWVTKKKFFGEREILQHSPKIDYIQR